MTLALPYPNIVNGTDADVSQIMANENYLLGVIAGGQTYAPGVYPPGTYTFVIDTVLTTPIIMLPGATLVANNCHVTLPGAFLAPLAGCLQTIGSGRFTFSETPLTGVPPEWWIASDVSIGLQAAINSGASRLRFSSTTYLLTAEKITLVSNQAWVGEGLGSTIIRWTVPPTTDAITSNNISNFTAAGITFDGNGQLTSTTSGGYPGLLPIINLEVSVNCDVSKCQFIGWSTCAVLANFDVGGNYSNNIITRATASSSQNYGILISSGIGEGSVRTKVNDNTCVNCQISVNMAFADILGNDVSGWGFSAGINVQAISTTSDLNIGFNICHDNAVTPDTFGYYGDGIEQWARNSRVFANECYNCSGNGISANGRYSVYTGNTCYNNGNSAHSAAGILVYYQDATYNGANSSFNGNVCFDNRGTKYQLYGYQEEAVAMAGLRLSGNSFAGNGTAPMSLFNASTVVDGLQSGTFTPTPTGAATFSAASGTWCIGEHTVTVTCDVTLNATADTAAFGLGLVSWGVATPSPAAASACVAALAGSGIRLYLSAGSGLILADQSAGAVTNATLSGKRVVMSLTYPI
jgi:hypothetical protein